MRMLALAAVGVALLFGAAPRANAGVHVGVGIGVPGPVYYGPNPYYAQRSWVPGHWEYGPYERVWIPGHWVYYNNGPYYDSGPTVFIGGGFGGYHHWHGHHH